MITVVLLPPEYGATIGITPLVRRAIAAALFLLACAPALTPAPTVPPAANVRVRDPNQHEIDQRIPIDGIPPIYDPRFVVAAQAPLPDDELVIGIALGGEAKAYPVGVLRFREIVNDELAGLPILVSW